jgi:hypothetical protein
MLLPLKLHRRADGNAASVELVGCGAVFCFGSAPNHAGGGVLARGGRDRGREGSAAESGDFASRTASPKLASRRGRMAREIARLVFTEAVGLCFCCFFLFLPIEKDIEELLKLLLYVAATND